MLEQIVVEAVKQVPALVVLAYLTLSFIKSQQKTAEMFSERIETVTADCHEVTKDATLAIRENTKILGRVVGVLEKGG